MTDHLGYVLSACGGVASTIALGVIVNMLTPGAQGAAKRLRDSWSLSRKRRRSKRLAYYVALARAFQSKPEQFAGFALELTTERVAHWAAILLAVTFGIAVKVGTLFDGVPDSMRVALEWYAAGWLVSEVVRLAGSANHQRLLLMAFRWPHGAEIQWSEACKGDPEFPVDVESATNRWGAMGAIPGGAAAAKSNLKFDLRQD